MSYHNESVGALGRAESEVQMLRSEINRLQERLNNADDNVKLADALEQERRFLYGVILAVVVQNGGSFSINESTFEEIAGAGEMVWESREVPEDDKVVLELKEQEDG